MKNVTVKLRDETYYLSEKIVTDLLSKKIVTDLLSEKTERVLSGDRNV